MLNAGFCKLCINDLKIIKNFQQTIEIFHGFSLRNVTGANPLNVHVTFLVDKIDV